MNMLTDQETEPLTWTNAPFSYPGLVRIRTIPDGSCFFHALVKAYFTPYQTGMLDGKVFDRIDFVKRLRADLAAKLAQPVDLTTRLTYYDVISRGRLRELVAEDKRYTLENMQRELRSSSPVDNLYNEFISIVLNKDIYLLDLATRDVYITGRDSDILYKNRPSIVILTMPGHYELVGLQTPNGIRTLFTPDSPLISSIRQRMAEKIAVGSRK